MVVELGETENSGGSFYSLLGVSVQIVGGVITVIVSIIFLLPFGSFA